MNVGIYACVHIYGRTVNAVIGPSGFEILTNEDKVKSSVGYQTHFTCTDPSVQTSSIRHEPISYSNEAFNYGQGGMGAGDKAQKSLETAQVFFATF